MKAGLTHRGRKDAGHAQKLHMPCYIIYNKEWRLKSVPYLLTLRVGINGFRGGDDASWWG